MTAFCRKLLRVGTLAACLAGFSTSARAADASDPTVACPSETFWDGFACTHARVTCGGWDGVSCDGAFAGAAAVERNAEQAYAAVDADARTVCPEGDERKQSYHGSVREVVRAIEAALESADKLAARLASIRVTRSTPSWVVLTYARAGSLYDCVWNSVRQSQVTFLTPQQAAQLARAQAATSQFPNGQQLQQYLQDAMDQVRDKWESTKRQYMDVLAAHMVDGYVNAAVLARRHALDGFSFTRAHDRLPIVTRQIGDAMRDYVGRLADPTDPEPDPSRKRHLTYVVGYLTTIDR